MGLIFWFGLQKWIGGMTRHISSIRILNVIGYWYSETRSEKVMGVVLNSSLSNDYFIEKILAGIEYFEKT